MSEHNKDKTDLENNKGKKSLALIFWILTKEYLKAKGKIKSDTEFKATVDEFTQEYI